MLVQRQIVFARLVSSLIALIGALLLIWMMFVLYSGVTVDAVVVGSEGIASGKRVSSPIVEFSDPVNGKTVRIRASLAIGPHTIGESVKVVYSKGILGGVLIWSSWDTLILPIGLLIVGAAGFIIFGVAAKIIRHSRRPQRTFLPGRKKG